VLATTWALPLGRDPDRVHKIVSCTAMSIEAFDRTTPVNPPNVNKHKNPTVNTSGV